MAHDIQDEQVVNALHDSDRTILQKIANTIRHLSIDAVQKANSGHPGLPLGCAEIGAYLYGHFLRYNSKDSKWVNRDIFVLSAGHGSMLLYSCLHLAGFNLSLDEIKNFRQLHSQTPGHPESLETDGVETTTGPLGQGMGNAIGLALAYKIMQQKFNGDKEHIIDNKICALVSDGDIMEGCSHEASSLAGHWGLNNLIAIYDANGICLDGNLSECFSENVKMRYESYGWQVYTVDGHSFDELHEVLSAVRTNQTKPVLVIAHTVIGKGSPHKANSHKAHGSPLGEEEVKLTKEALGLPQEEFYIPQAVQEFFQEKIQKEDAMEEAWRKRFESWSRSHPEKREMFDKMAQDFVPEDLEQKLANLEITAPVSGRKASQAVSNFLAEELPQLYSGSADLSTSDCTTLKKYPTIEKGNFQGRNIKFGVREFGMATIATGLRQSHLIVPFIGTFLTFSDYMRNAIRLAALMKRKVIYHFTHDSIFLGEDGPTHQPIEQLASLRAIPNLQVIRPSGVQEVKMAWLQALSYHGPTCLILTRQNIQEVAGTNVSYQDGMAKGGYIVKKETGTLAYTLMATGSELPLAMEVASELEKHDKPTRVISMPCSYLFDRQSKEYRDAVLGSQSAKRVSIEAASDQSWYKYIGVDGVAIAMESFGASAPASALAKEFGFTVEAILDRIL